MNNEAQKNRDILDEVTCRNNLTDNAMNILKTFSDEKLAFWAKMNHRPEHFYQELETKMAVAISGLIWAKSIRRRWWVSLWTIAALCAIAAYTVGPDAPHFWRSRGMFVMISVFCILFDGMVIPGIRFLVHSKKRLKESEAAYERAAIEFAEAIKPLLSSTCTTLQIRTTAEMTAKLEETVLLELTAQKTLAESVYPVVDAVRMKERSEQVIQLNALSNYLWKLNFGLDYGVESRQGLTDRVKNRMK
jgi:hypothetical protein